MTLLARQQDLGFTAKKPKDDSMSLTYKHPGNVKVRLTLFWVKNALNIDGTSEVLIAKAGEILRNHGLGLDVYPAPKCTSAHTIETPANVISARGLLINDPEHGYNHYNEIRLERSRIYDDQKTPSKKQRLPVFFCEFKEQGHGRTVVAGPWPPFCLIGGDLKQTPDNATVAHEIVHAAGIAGHLLGPANQKNLMADPTTSRYEMFEFQVLKVAGAYFCK